jgi:hypothetical protein
MTKLLTINHALLPHRYSSKHKKEDDEFSVDLTMFDIKDNKSSVDLTIFDTDDDKSFDPDDYCDHIEKVSTSIQMFIIFTTSLIITN